MKRLLQLTFIVLLTGLGLGSADATVRFCFEHEVDFIDSGEELSTSCTSYSPDRCEDDWTTNDSYAVRGIRVKVEKNIGGTYTQIWSNYTDDGDGSDGAGCTPALDPSGVNTGYYKFTVYSRAKVKGNYVYSRNTSDELASQTWVTYVATDGLTYTYSFNPSTSSYIKERFDVLDAATHALYDVHYGMNLRYYYFELDPSESNRYDSDDHRIYIDADGTGPTRKFIIGHELGHAVLDDIMGSNYINDCSSSDTGGTCTSAAGQHGVTTKEFQSCAMNEGHSHFYASAAFNSASETDCYLHHWGSGRGTINCESGSNSTNNYSTLYMENECSATSHDGKGVELDWWRTFWDLRTNSSVTYADMKSWLEDGSARAVWDDDDVYEALDDEANSIGGTFDSTWSTAAQTYNGIDHPMP